MILGIASISACFEYDDMVERLRLHKQILDLAYQYPEHYGPMLSQWTSGGGFNKILRSELGSEDEGSDAEVCESILDDCVLSECSAGDPAA